MNALTVRRLIQASGLVQGVGFRPFVFRLASELELGGSVKNTASGVTIEVQGDADAVERFLIRLQDEAPPLAQVQQLTLKDLDCLEEDEFRIVESSGGEPVHTLIPPDVAVCDDCLREMFDPLDRRFHYPFINCTNCGPRFTIVRRIPYDRPGTSMARFRMCAACQAEYDDPRSRRFHAQPNACPECGPNLELRCKDSRTPSRSDPIDAAIRFLRSGQIGAIKGLGGFHLAADALNAAAVGVLRERKRRVEKPFAVMVPNLETAEEFCEVNEVERKALLSFERPIVLLRRKPDCAIPEEVAPRVHELGLFLPYTPVHHLLFRRGGFKALVMTSGNASEEPIAIGNNEAYERLYDLADLFLVHDRDILLRCDDSVVRVENRKIQQVRRSRGFVPAPVLLHKEVPAILAVGGELKNTICLAQRQQAFLSQHIGDLENLAAYGFLVEAIDHLQTILEIDPQIIAYDLHPDYLSTQWALRQKGRTLVGVQHHHAHIASCMAESHLEGAVIGLALDGTGYGTDRHVWGGEVLIVNYEKFTRAAHFEYVMMPGAEAAIREPWRMAVSYLAHSFGPGLCRMKLPFLGQIDAKAVALTQRMIERHVNAPLTSSCGRLFDAVSSIAGVRQVVDYEGQAAIEFEMAADGCQDEGRYPFELRAAEDGFVIAASAMIQALVGDVLASVPVSVISARFHNGLADVLARSACLVREQTGLERVCLSGGTFNNRLLLRKLTALLEAEGFAVFAQHQVPCGDGGLSLGQAMIAAHRCRGVESPESRTAWGDVTGVTV
jgi:hydrogenase maturation protein HypF